MAPLWGRITRPTSTPIGSNCTSIDRGGPRQRFGEILEQISRKLAEISDAKVATFRFKVGALAAELRTTER